MSEPNREAEIADAKSQGAKWDGNEWQYPNKTKKKKVANKIASVEKLKTLMKDKTDHWDKFKKQHKIK